MTDRQDQLDDLADLRRALETARAIARSLLPATRQLVANLDDMVEEVDFLEAIITVETATESG